MVPSRILITGANSLLGGYLLPSLTMETPVKFLLLGRSRPLGLERFPAEWVGDDPLSFRQLRGQIADFRPNLVIHMAASGMKSLEKEQWKDLIDFNVNESLELFLASINPELRGFVYLSTGLVHEPSKIRLDEQAKLGPHGGYPASKLACEILLRSAAQHHGIPAYCLRPFSFTGIGDHEERLFPNYLRCLHESRPLKLRNPDTYRDFCAAEDIANCIKILSKEILNSGGCEQRVFNLGTGLMRTVRDWVAKVNRDLGVSLEIKCQEASSPRAGHIASISKATQFLGWKPKIDLSYAVWQLSEDLYPGLLKKVPRKDMHD